MQSSADLVMPSTGTNLEDEDVLSKNVLDIDGRTVGVLSLACGNVFIVLLVLQSVRWNIATNLSVMLTSEIDAFSNVFLLSLCD